MAALGAPAHASIFERAAGFASDGGTAVIDVCLVEGSSTEEKSQRCSGCAHAPNPGLNQVVAHVKQALAQSWEAHGGVRFVGFDWCTKRGPDRQNVVGLFIHPQAENAAYAGAGSLGRVDRADPGIGFKPWGNGAACIGFDWSAARMEYRFDCVEQYAIHEFGHVLGFAHEWRHPNKPRGCNDDPKHSEPLIADAGTDFVIASPAYDWDSIMTYTDACADVTGVRFGSTNLSPTDIAGVSAAYPRVGLSQSKVVPLPELGADHPAQPWGLAASSRPVVVLLSVSLVWRLRRRARR